MGFDDGSGIIAELIKFSLSRRGVNSDAVPTCYYDFANPEMPEIPMAERHFDVVLIDVSFYFFKLMTNAVYGRDLLANLQSMINEDALLLGTRTHVFTLDIKSRVWSAKRVEQQRREKEAEKVARAKRGVIPAEFCASDTGGYGDYLTLCSPTTSGAHNGAATRVSVDTYVFGVDTLLPDSAAMMKATPALFGKFCVFLGDLIANHLRRPHAAREHCVIMSGFVRSTAQRPPVYQQVRTVFLETVVLDEHEQRVMAALSHDDGGIAHFLVEQAAAATTLAPSSSSSATTAPMSSTFKEQEARARHVETDQVVQTVTDAPPIGEAEAQIIYYIEKLVRDADAGSAANKQTLAFLIRSEDTDCVALALLFVPRLLRAGDDMIAHRLWIDLSHRGVKRLLDVVCLWRALLATEARLVLRRTDRRPATHVIEWLVLLLNLSGNDYCGRMSHVSAKLLLDNAERLLGMVAGCNTPPLMFCETTHDMVVREMLLAQFVLNCLEQKKQVADALRRFRVDPKMHHERVLREKFQFLSKQFVRSSNGVGAVSGTGSRALIVSPFCEVEAHVRRAAACLNYQMNVARPDYVLLDAYALGPDQQPLYGYRQWQQTTLSATHGFAPPVKNVYEMARHVTPFTVVRHPFIRRRRLLVNDPPPPPTPSAPTPPASQTSTATPAVPAPLPKSNGTFDRKRKEFSRDEVEDIDDDDDDSTEEVVVVAVSERHASKRTKTASDPGAASTTTAAAAAAIQLEQEKWLVTSNGVQRREVDINSGEFGSFLGGGINKFKAHSH
jgi:hypothetical protein